MIYNSGTDHKEDVEKYASAAKKEDIDRKNTVGIHKSEADLEAIALKKQLERDKFLIAQKEHGRKEAETIKKEQEQIVSDAKESFNNKHGDIVYTRGIDVNGNMGGILFPWEIQNGKYIKGKAVYANSIQEGSVLDSEQEREFKELYQR